MKAKINYSLISNESKSFKSRFINVNNNHLRSGDVLVIEDNGVTRYANFICYTSLGDISSELVFLQVASSSDIKKYQNIIMNNLIEKPLRVTGGVHRQLKEEFKIKNIDESTVIELTKKVIFSIHSNNFKITGQGSMKFRYEKLLIIVRGHTITSIVDVNREWESNAIEEIIIHVNESFDKKMESIQEIEDVFVQRSNEIRNPLSGQELMSESVRLLKELRAEGEIVEV